MNIKHFDKLLFVDEAKRIGFSEQQARLIAQKLEEVEEFKSDELATKADIKDLRFEMRDLEIKLIKWQFGIGAAIVASTFAMLKYLH